METIWKYSCKRTICRVTKTFCTKYHETEEKQTQNDDHPYHWLCGNTYQKKVHLETKSQIGDRTRKAEIKITRNISKASNTLQGRIFWYSHQRITSEEKPRKKEARNKEHRHCRAQNQLNCGGHVENQGDIPMVRNQTKRVGRTKSWQEESNHRNVAPRIKKWQSRNTVFPITNLRLKWKRELAE